MERGSRPTLVGIKSWAHRSLGYRPFLVLLGLGALIRLATMVMYSPAWLQSVDEIRFSRIDPTQIYGDFFMPAVYAMFVRVMREISSELWITIGVQHLIGLSIGVFLYLAMRRLGVKPWLSCIPAGAAFLSGDQVWIEHQIVAETFMTALLAAGLACAIRGLVPKVDLRWLAAGSALVMLGGLSRSVGLAALPVLVLCTAFWVGGSKAARLRALAAALLPAVLVFGLYYAGFKAADGQYLGINDMAGWNIYSRVAPFADCSRFTPPEGTRKLCESIPTSERDGPLGYSWDPETRGRQEFSYGPETAPIMGRFAREVILHEPFSYLHAVAIDAARYLDPGIGENRPYSGFTHEIQSFANNDLATREFVEEQMGSVWSGVRVHVVGEGLLAAYQELFRVGGLLIAALVVLTVFGMWAARGAVRLGLFLFGLTGLLLYIVPVATLSYEVRYGIPPVPFIVVSGTLGFGVLLSRLRSETDVAFEGGPAPAAAG